MSKITTKIIIIDKYDTDFSIEEVISQAKESEKVVLIYEDEDEVTKRHAAMIYAACADSIIYEEYK